MAMYHDWETTMADEKKPRRTRKGVVGTDESAPGGALEAQNEKGVGPGLQGLIDAAAAAEAAGGPVPVVTHEAEPTKLSPEVREALLAGQPVPVAVTGTVVGPLSAPTVREGKLEPLAPRADGFTVGVAPEVLDYHDAEDGQVDLGWAIRTPADADWALSRIGHLQREQQENEAMLREAVARLEARVATLNGRLQHGVRFFEWKLGLYARDNREAIVGTGKKKSRNYLHGRIGWRKKGGGLKVVDEAALLKWCQEQPPEAGVLRITEAPALKAVKELVEKTGELPPGVEQEDERDELYFDAELPVLTGGKGVL
jgi:phage host-nuclease inhibitor protein Gam